HDAAHTGDGIHALDKVVAPLLKHLAHVLYSILLAGQSLYSGPLAYGGRSTGGMAQIVAHDFGYLLVCRGVAYAPAGHGVGLGDTVYEYGVFLYVFAQTGEAGEGLSVIHQLVVYLVGYDIEVVLHAHVGQSLELVLSVDHTGGV